MEKRTAESSADSVKAYEVAYLLTPLLPEERAAEVSQLLIADQLTAAGGRVISSDAPKMIPLAYPIKKVVEHKSSLFREAYFGWTRFEAPAEFAPALIENLKKAPEVVRSLVIALPKEALREVVKRPRRVPTAAVTPEGESPVTGAVPLDEAVLDTKIDELLVTPQA